MFESVSSFSNKLAYSVSEAAIVTSLSEPYLRLEIRKKKLRAKKVGIRVLVLHKDLEAYLESREDWEPSSKN